MNHNGIPLKFSEKDFKGLLSEQRDYVLYASIETLTESINGIQKEGCRWGRERETKKNRREYSLSGLMGFIGGFLSGKLPW